jgi:hypothetical protein
LNNSCFAREFDFVGQVYGLNPQCLRTSLGNQEGGGRNQGTKTVLTTMGHGAIIMFIERNLVLCSNSICDNCN